MTIKLLVILNLRSKLQESIPQQTKTLDKELQEEVARTGIKLDKSIQVSLPKAKVGIEKPSSISKSEDDSKYKIVKAPGGRFTLQVASFQTMDEVKRRIKQLETVGAKPFYRQTDIAGKGKWFRVYMGGYSTKRDADRIGKGYITKKVISSYVVRNMPQK